MPEIRILTSTRERPTAIKIICIMGLIGSVLSIPMFVSEVARQFGSWFSPYAGFIALANLVCMLGLWKIKKWGFYSYLILVLLNQVALVSQDLWQSYILIIHAVIVLIVLYHLLPATQPKYELAGSYLKRKARAILIAYMLGIHNSYRDLEDDPDSVSITIIEDKAQEDDSPLTDLE